MICKLFRCTNSRTNLSRSSADAKDVVDEFTHFPFKLGVLGGMEVISGRLARMRGRGRITEGVRIRTTDIHPQMNIDNRTSLGLPCPDRILCSPDGLHVVLHQKKSDGDALHHCQFTSGPHGRSMFIHAYNSTANPVCLACHKIELNSQSYGEEGNTPVCTNASRACTIFSVRSTSLSRKIMPSCCISRWQRIATEHDPFKVLIPKTNKTPVSLARRRSRVYSPSSRSRSFDLTKKRENPFCLPTKNTWPSLHPWHAAHQKGAPVDPS